MHKFARAHFLTSRSSTKILRATAADNSSCEIVGLILHQGPPKSSFFEDNSISELTAAELLSHTFLQKQESKSTVLHSGPPGRRGFRMQPMTRLSSTGAQTSRSLKNTQKHGCEKDFLQHEFSFWSSFILAAQAQDTLVGKCLWCRRPGQNNSRMDVYRCPRRCRNFHTPQLRACLFSIDAKIMRSLKEQLRASR